MSEAEKVLSLSDLSKLSSSLKREGKKVVLCHGTFDLLHIGHIKHIQYAKKLGDILIVTITADEYVNKGPDRPIFTHSLRAENIAAIGCVDYVAINHKLTSVNVIEAIKPDIYVKGNEYQTEKDDVTGNISTEKNEVEKYGGKIEYTDEITFSSSSLINKCFDVFDEETKGFLSKFKMRYTSKEIINSIDSLQGLKAIVIGDGIIDEYRYVEPLGQSGKGNIPAFNYRRTERFAGGSFAVANHIAGFVDEVTLLTAIGKDESDLEFIQSKLKDNVKPEIYCYNSAPTLTKCRYVDGDMNKHFEIYLTEIQPMDELLEEKIITWLEDNLESYDVVIVPDFGNGFISQKMVSAICKNSNFLAVNTQLNSGNRGYHVITRYPEADFVSLNEHEVRIAAHNKHGELESITKEINEKVSSSYTAITRGVDGVMLLDGDEFINIPAISTKVVDRIGAGDAFLSISALCLAKKMKPELSAFLGSIAAALDVQIVCNRDFIDPVAVKKYVTTLFK